MPPGKRSTTPDPVKVSVIIVNYNVKDYLAQALHSIERSLADISHEIVVVDNASVDGSVPFLRKEFPHIKIIENRQNLGFARANNQALKIVKGEYVVLINPDTVVQEDTFSRLLQFFEETPQAAAATCKIINPDGTFSVDCRHAVPTPSVAFWKVAGLNKLFPRSKIFGQYNLTYLDANETYPVPAISGSFMMIKKKVLDTVGHFDERFFMYCEDIDLCHRINEAGFKIYYVPATQIIHYKGESSKRGRLDYIRNFNHSLHEFFKKYYASKSTFLFHGLISLGIYFRGFLIYVQNYLKLYFPLLLDLVLLNGALLSSLVVRFHLKGGFYWSEYVKQYWAVNLIATLLFLLIATYYEIYPKYRFSIHSILKANFLTFLCLVALTFFLKQFAFSRLAFVATFFLSPLLMSLWRAIFRRFHRGDSQTLGSDPFSKPTVVVGKGRDAIQLYEKLAARKDFDYELIGWVSVDDSPEGQVSNHFKYLGSLDTLDRIIKYHGIRQVIFSAGSLKYEQILRTMSAVNSPTIDFKLVPSNLEVIIGKSHIEKLDAYPLLDIEYAYGKRFNQISKRLFDLIISVVLMILLLPFAGIGFLRYRTNFESTRFLGKNKKEFTLPLVRQKQNSLVNLYVFLMAVFRGRLSLVGSPLQTGGAGSEFLQYGYTPGLTGLVQINYEKIFQPEDAERYHLFYLKNHSLILDIEILLKTIWKHLIRGKMPPMPW
ncbi:MAG: glycosyltransferase [Calditrichia bacterium]